MSINKEKYREILKAIEGKAQLIAVSKTKPNEDILDLYKEGQRDFGENYVQELADKAVQLPTDIKWHFIGHLQSNKVKFIASFVHLIHGVDSLSLLKEINKQGQKNQRVIDCLLQIHIASEETKFGLDEIELNSIAEFISSSPLPFVQIKGLMGMASFSDNQQLVSDEFKQLKALYTKYAQSFHQPFSVLSMGMSGDYKIAIAEGSNAVRIGSLLFGARNYDK